MTNTHKAWRLHAHNDLRFDEVETPRPALDGVVVRIEAGMVLSYTGKVLSGSVPIACRRCRSCPAPTRSRG
jgi:alcohol dehydrogenase